MPNEAVNKRQCLRMHRLGEAHSSYSSFLTSWRRTIKNNPRFSETINFNCLHIFLRFIHPPPSREKRVDARGKRDPLAVALAPHRPEDDAMSLLGVPFQTTTPQLRCARGRSYAHTSIRSRVQYNQILQSFESEGSVAVLLQPSFATSRELHPPNVRRSATQIPETGALPIGVCSRDGGHTLS